MTEKILLVDDDPNILNGYRRTLRKHFKLRTALGPELALEVFQNEGPFAVVISDMKMPVMNGIQFLSRINEIEPNTVGIMLTGHADLTTAMNAINEGHIFRFLTKPCSPEEMSRAIEAGIRQYRLQHAEKELLEQTLKKNIKLLTDILGMVNPTAFGRASRINRYIKQMLRSIRMNHFWQLDTAAMLSQIGFLALPERILEKVYTLEELSPEEKEMFFEYPKIGARLIGEIPRMEIVAKIIERQLWDYERFATSETLTEEQKLVNLGAQILRCVLSFDEKISRGLSQDAAIAILKKKPHKYNPKTVALLENVKIDTSYKVSKEVTVEELTTNVITLEEVRSSGGLLLVAKFQEITPAIIERLIRFKKEGGVKEPIKVAVLEKPEWE
ncbi:MAG TPA: response regulator [Caldithrix abyssi]|uniref:Response regulator n=1 Tax=Caldithrix abyssi TaxID=187145 RepID=A0A7V5UEP5_CALAY|nr:response regulator [Caldithrix abyssi]